MHIWAKHFDRGSNEGGAAPQAPISALTFRRLLQLHNMKQHHCAPVFLTETKSNARSTNCLVCLPQRTLAGGHHSLPIPRHRCLKTIRLRTARPLPFIVNNLHPHAEYWPGASMDSLQLSFQHVHQQRVATNGDANFLRQPVHELLCPERVLKSCFAHTKN